MNFNIRYNILSNGISKVYSQREIELKTYIKNHITQALSLENFMETSNNVKTYIKSEPKNETNYFEATYVIKERKEYKNDNDYKNALRIFGENFKFLSDENCILKIDGKIHKFKNSKKY